MDEQITLHGENATLLHFTAGSNTSYGEPVRTYESPGTTERVLIQKLAQSTGSLLSDLETGKPGEPGYVVFFKTTAPGIIAHVRVNTTYGLLELTDTIRQAKQRGVLSHIEVHASKVPEA